MKKPRSNGSIMLLVIVFGGIFFTLLMALSGFVLAENRAQDVSRTHAEALSIAEAGLDYYRWFLSHFPGNTQNGTGHGGPYVITYADPEYRTAGTYALTVTGNSSCGAVQSMDVTSKGVPTDAPGISTTLVARFAPPSVASYSYIVGESVWAGADRIINGPYHSNGGIRMDGTTNAPVTSSLSTWNCTSSYGCSPTQGSAPGVVGSGTNQNLWNYPTPQIDFDAIAANFTSLKSTAQASGLFFDRFSNGNNQNNSYYKGYHLVFNANGTVSVYKVGSETKLTGVTPINPNSGTTDYTLINNENLYGTYTIPASCAVIFIQDHTWIEGTITRKVTVVAADVTNVGVSPYVVLKNNIVYSAYDGTVGLTVISSGDVLIAPDSPTNMTLNGIFVAQGGAFGRNFYGCSNAYEPRGTLTILGTTVSNLRTGTKWMTNCSGGDMGYQTRIDAYDRQNAGNPPPFTPLISTQWQFVDWQQIR